MFREKEQWRIKQQATLLAAALTQGRARPPQRTQQKVGGPRP